METVPGLLISHLPSTCLLTHTHPSHSCPISLRTQNHSLALDFTHLKGAENGERGTLFFLNLIETSMVAVFPNAVPCPYLQGLHLRIQSTIDQIFLGKKIPESSKGKT